MRSTSRTPTSSAAPSTPRSRAPYIDSTGIGVLVGAAHRAQEAGKQLVVASPQKNVARVLGLLGVADDLNIRQ